MTLSQFERQIGRTLVVEPAGKRAFRCFFEGVLFAERPGLCGVTTTIIAAGPNRQRARGDFVQKIRGKFARVYHGSRSYTEFPVPVALTE
jgi:hypothetical protein